MTWSIKHAAPRHPLGNNDKHSPRTRLSSGNHYFTIVRFIGSLSQSLGERSEIQAVMSPFGGVPPSLPPPLLSLRCVPDPKQDEERSSSFVAAAACTASLGHDRGRVRRLLFIDPGRRWFQSSRRLAQRVVGHARDRFLETVPLLLPPNAYGRPTVG